MDPHILVKGMVIGFCIAAPVGPVGALCIRRTLSQGYVAGLASGLGAASADGVYGGIAALGLTAFAKILLEQMVWLQLFGGVLLCILGVQAMLSRPGGKHGNDYDSGLIHVFVSAFFLTVANPLTLLAFGAILSGLGVGVGADYSDAFTLVVAVFIGSAAWWLLLSGGISLIFKKVVDARRLLWINRIAGAAILGFGILSLCAAGVKFMTGH